MRLIHVLTSLFTSKLNRKYEPARLISSRPSLIVPTGRFCFMVALCLAYGLVKTAELRKIAECFGSLERKRSANQT